MTLKPAASTFPPQLRRSGPERAHHRIGLALALQLAFAALLTVGRAVDLQAGYAFALIADPTNRSQMPLIGTLFAYAAAAIFFTTDGPADLLAILSLSIEKVPLGAALSGDSVAVLTA